MAGTNRRRKLNLSLKSNQIPSFVLLGILFLSCSQTVNDSNGFSSDETVKPGISIYGQTQGTTYVVLCNDRIEITKAEIDQILSGFDASLSTYIPSSVISKFNAAPAGEYRYVDSLGYFNDCMSLSQIVYEETNGAFDPSVYPLLETWGFLKNRDELPDSLNVQRDLRIIGFKPGYHYLFKPNEDDTLPSKIIKKTPQFKLVFNAIAQGQAVDVLSSFLEKKGAKNYFVEIGGEVFARGVNAQGKTWSVGIDKPIDNSNANTRELIHIIELNNKAVATSGNYRQFYIKDGIKYSHTLNPKTGYPVKHQLLSATVVSTSCALADGYATAFMVMGPQKTINFVQESKHLNIETFLIYNGPDGQLETYSTEGFREIIKT